MEPDPLKSAWQSQPHPAIDRERMLTELRRDEQAFAQSIFWRDVREVGVSLAMAPIWVFLGVTLSLPWTWHLMVPAFLWTAGFLLVDRLRRRNHSPDPAEPLAASVERALAQVEHQIWLLRGVVWWYLLPFALPGAAFVAQSTWDAREGGWPAMLVMLLAGGGAGAILVWVYSVNQAAVREELEPRRRELQTLLAGLQDPPAAAE